MATNLERRITAMESKTMHGSGFTIIVIQVVSPGNLKPENRFCMIEGVTYTCGADELPADFDNRMRSIAEELNSRLGRPIRIICSPTDLTL